MYMLGVQKELKSRDMCPHMSHLPRGMRHVINQTNGPHSSTRGRMTYVTSRLRLCTLWLCLVSNNHQSGEVSKSQNFLSLAWLQSMADDLSVDLMALVIPKISQLDLMNLFDLAPNLVVMIT
jgi:hypothetical protein